jgi:hypothetical protein
MVYRVFKDDHLQCLQALEWNGTRTGRVLEEACTDMVLTWSPGRTQKAMKSPVTLAFVSEPRALYQEACMAVWSYKPTYSHSLGTNWTQTTVGRQLDTSEIYLTASLHLVAKREIPVSRNQPPYLRQSVHLPTCLLCKLNVLFNGNCFGFVCTKKIPKCVCRCAPQFRNIHETVKYALKHPLKGKDYPITCRDSTNGV